MVSPANKKIAATAHQDALPFSEPGTFKFVCKDISLALPYLDIG